MLVRVRFGSRIEGAGRVAREEEAAVRRGAPFEVERLSVDLARLRLGLGVGLGLGLGLVLGLG